MAFRETLAWIACLMLGGGQPTATRLVAAVFIQTALAAALAATAAATWPGAASQPRDEREKLIGLLAARNGYFVLACLIFWVIAGGLFLGWSAPATALAALAAFLAAEVVRYASQIVSYRRGA